MPIPTTGPITLSMLRTEFGGSGPIKLSDFYRGGALVGNITENLGVPTSGAISLSDFRGATAFVEVLLPPLQAYITNTLSEFEDATAVSNNPPSQQDVFNTWARFGDGIYYPSGAQPQGEAMGWSYQNGAVVSNINSGSVIGFVSPQSLEYYTHSALMTSSDADDDAIGIIAAFTAPGGAPRGIMVVRTCNGIYQSSWGIYELAGGNMWPLVYSSAAPAVGGGWAANGATRVQVTRSGNTITAKCSQFGSVLVDESTTLTYEIPVNSVFAGPRPYGYMAQSQNGSTFSNIALTGGLDASTIYNGSFSPPKVFVFSNGAWAEDPNRNIFSDLAYPRLVTNPTTGKVFKINGPPMNTVVEVSP